jgi:hypothetical protein
MNYPMIFLNLTQRLFFRCGLLIAGIIFLLNVKSNGQDNAPVKFGKITLEDFRLNSPIIDSNTDAVTILDRGDISFEGNEKGWFNYVFKRSKRIMIIKNNGFDLATEKLLLYKDKDAKEVIDNLSEVTYNIENGKIIETKLNLKDVFEEKYDPNHFYKKFTMPAVKKGSIIEYSYTIRSGFIFNIPSWEFQSVACPTLWSEYNIAIPGLLSYMTILQGTHKFDINKSGEGFKTYRVNRVNANGGGFGVGVEERIIVSSSTTLHRWVMKNIPVFYSEKYISSPANFIDKISFQLYKTYDGENYHDVANSWEKVTEELMKREDFGKPLGEENEWLDKITAQVVQQNDNSLQAAKKIYYYLQNNYTCTNHYDKYIKTSLQDVVKKKSGTVGDINLLLIAMLNRKKINALPVLLSTSESGRTSSNYPIMEQLNYVIGKINIESTDYYLDATVPFLPFGKLPLNCYNGYGRVISFDTAAVYFEPDSLKEARMVSVFVGNTDNKEVGGSYMRNMGFFESLAAKTEIDKSTLPTYEINLKALFPEDILVGNIQVDSLLLPEKPVSVKFDFKLSSFDNADIVYFNPLLGEALKENPFYASERVYPVEMPYTTDNLYNLSMEIPTGYRVDELPKSARVKLNDTEGMFEYLINADASSIQMRCRLVIKKANFTPDDYHTLRDFYAFIVKKEAEQVVFKKIK